MRLLYQSHSPIRVVRRVKKLRILASRRIRGGLRTCECNPADPDFHFGNPRTRFCLNDPLKLAGDYPLYLRIPYAINAALPCA